MPAVASYNHRFIAAFTSHNQQSCILYISNTLYKNVTAVVDFCTDIKFDVTFQTGLNCILMSKLISFCSCQYDSLEILELQSNSTVNSPSNQSSSTKQEKISRTGSQVNYNFSKPGKKICGDWTKKLKLLRYTTASKSTQVVLKFESDFSHHFPGFKVKVTMEKGKRKKLCPLVLCWNWKMQFIPNLWLSKQ